MSEAEQDATEFDETIAEVLEQIPGWEGSGTQWEWLSGGGAHKNFLVSKGDDSTRTVLKLWNRDWERLGVIPPSAVPLHNTAEAGRIGIGAAVVAITNEPLAVMLEFLPGSPVDLKNDSIRARVAQKARQLHDSGMDFLRDFNPFAEARVMMASAVSADVTLPGDYAEVLPTISRIEKTLDLRPREFVPSHNDLYRANLLELADGQIRLIDYDLSGNSDRCYDLGLMSTFEGLDSDQMSQLTYEYFGEDDKRMRARVELFALAADYSQFALFVAATAAADKNDDYDYVGFMNQNWSNIVSRVSDEQFGNYLDQA